MKRNLRDSISERSYVSVAFPYAGLNRFRFEGCDLRP
jgi:hypothetical protein